MWTAELSPYSRYREATLVVEPAIVALDRDGLPLDCATKACAGDGVKTLRRWLDDGKADVLILHNGRGEPLVLLSWGTWNRVARAIAPQLQDLSE